MSEITYVVEYGDDDSRELVRYDNGVPVEWLPDDQSTMFPAASAVLAPDDEVIARLARACIEPGAVVERMEQYPPMAKQAEPMWHWQLRAVMSTLFEYATGGDDA